LLCYQELRANRVTRATDYSAVKYSISEEYGSENLVKHFTKKNGFIDSRVSTILQDENGNIWFGTDKGVRMLSAGLIDQRKDTSLTFLEVDQNDGLSSNKIYLMAIDDQGFLWIGTNKGLDRLDLDHFYKTEKIAIKHYGKKEGFIGLECNANAVMKDNSGKLWFGTVKGVTNYDHASDRLNTTEPFTKINNIRLFFENTNWEMFSDSLDFGTKLPLNLSLPYDKNHLTFDFLGVSMTIPSKVKYRFKLEGFDTDWNPVTQKTEATYANIPPGFYTFKVKACNNDGLWNQHSTEFNFTIIQPYWQTWWFRALVIMAIISIIWFVFYVRFKRLKTKNEMEKKMIELERSALQAQMNPHFIFNSLNSIQKFYLRA